MLLNIYLGQVLMLTSVERFRWVSLQLQHICNSRRFKIPQAVQDELGKLPDTLKESYDVIYDQILDYDDRIRQIVERAISLLLTLRHNLSNEAFISAVCAGYDDELDEITLLDICCNLITCDNGFRFVHLSAQEFVLQRPEYSAAHLRNVVPARACLSIYFSSEQSSYPHYYPRNIDSSRDTYTCWSNYACVFLGEHLSILDASLATALGVGLGDSLRSMIRRFLLSQRKGDCSPFSRWQYSVSDRLPKRLAERARRRELETIVKLILKASHPLHFMTAFNLKILPVQCGILVPMNGEADGYLPRRFEQAHDGGPQTLLSEFLENPPYDSWYLFLAVHELYIAEDVVPNYADREAFWGLRELPQLGHLKSVSELFHEFLEMGNSECVEITLLAHPNLMISFNMLQIACRKCPMSLETRRDLLSRYLRQNHPNGLPNLDMVDALDIMQLVVEKEPELTGNMELFIDIWRANSDTWSQKTWPLMDLLCSRKMDLVLNERFLSSISVNPKYIKIGKITPDRERFLTLLLCRPENSVRVDEHCFEVLVRNRNKSILKLASSLRPHTPINKATVRLGYQDGYWQAILTHPCPSASLNGLATVVIEQYPPDAIGFFLSRNKDIQIDNGMLSTIVGRWGDHGVDLFWLLMDSGRLVSDQVSREVLLAALRDKGGYFADWTALIVSRGWVSPEDDVFRVALKDKFENDELNRYSCRDYGRCLVEHGITVKLSDICDGALLDLRTSQLGTDTEATVACYLKFCAEKMVRWQLLRGFEEELARAAYLPYSIFPWH